MVDASLLNRVRRVPRLVLYGRATKIVGLVVEAVGLEVAMGDLCRIRGTRGGRSVLAEVVGFNEERTLLMPLGELGGVQRGSAVEPLGRKYGVDVGPSLLGRVLDAMGNPIDGKGPLRAVARVPLAGQPPAPLDRPPITEPFATGVRAVDGLHTMGRGQRMGIFAGSGVGKSTLLGMVARRASSDVNVIALLGERGREVRDFIETSLGTEGLARSVVVVATGDQSALLRARGASVASAIAEYFRDEGNEVLLMVDSVTRVAMAWREIGLAVGEPPTTRGYTPSVFANLPRLLERAGKGARGGITALYTVLVEGDDFNEPVADHARAVLDGHIVLSRRLASRGHFPAIEVTASKSRLRDHVIDADHRAAVERVLSVVAAYEEKQDLVSVGAYQSGTDPLVDAAIRHSNSIQAFLRQRPEERAPFELTLKALDELSLELAREAA
ncbi:MAG: FliI/YscN family ATPase [Gemmatimonadota bacterium]|nr:FliI/YscN family ATPase [Gemmatimonadota bacterium]